ncbi:MAG TPA: hypothetical protein VL588_07455, partial [Bdellovibrionota bacterium]|nr:hypothetical protein [Bdellovibrionota bacterium]
YLAESTNPEERRSGEDHRGRFYFRDDAGKMFWNPTVSVTIGGVGTHSDFSHQYYNPAIDNQMYINDDWTLGQSLSFTRAHYSHFSGGTRSDSTSSLDLSATRRINPKVSAIGEIRFTDQGSSDPSFTYNQVVISAGASYSL